MTRAMSEAANGRLLDMPSEGEIKLFKEMGSLFQPIFLVLSIAHLKDNNGTKVATPYALSLMPTSTALMAQNTWALSQRRAPRRVMGKHDDVFRSPEVQTASVAADAWFAIAPAAGPAAL